MNTEQTRTWFSNRQFIAMIRSALDEAGHGGIGISRQWIDEESQEHPYQLHVPVGSALSLALLPLDDFLDVKNSDDLMQHAREFALALANLSRAEQMLEKYARDIRKAAATEIAAARAEGLDLVVDGVGFKPTYAHHLAGQDWKDAALSILAAVKVRNTSFYLRPKVSEVWVEETTDMAKELAHIIEDQRERQASIQRLEALGADLIVDTITLDLLKAHALDASEVLTEVWKKQCVNLQVEHLGRPTSLSLVSCDGEVTASLKLDEAYWNGRHLWLRDDTRASGNGGLVGKSLGALVQHPVFSERPIIAVDDRRIDHFVFDLSEKAMFDADTGRIWREERLAA